VTAVDRDIIHTTVSSPVVRSLRCDFTLLSSQHDISPVSRTCYGAVCVQFINNSYVLLLECLPVCNAILPMSTLAPLQWSRPTCARALHWLCFQSLRGYSIGLGLCLLIHNSDVSHSAVCNAAPRAWNQLPNDQEAAVDFIIKRHLKS